MDGHRARRLKAGSPLGRAFDEANDMVMMTIYSLVLGFMMRWDCWFFEIIIFMLNIIFFCTEMKYILCKELILNIAEVGSIEIEHFFGTLFILTGIYGAGFYDQTLG